MSCGPSAILTVAIPNLAVASLHAFRFFDRMHAAPAPGATVIQYVKRSLTETVWNLNDDDDWIEKRVKSSDGGICGFDTPGIILVVSRVNN
ncbi:hypothetical protein VTO42DRAFT_2514 [Malbranchea cinnamomea]